MDGAAPTASLPVLMYHSISHIARGPMRSMAVPAGLLGEQLATLTDAGYALLGLTAALARRQADPQAPVIAVTFNDGYRDFLTSGLRVLSAAGARATLYVAVGHVGRPAAWLGKHADDFAPMLSWDEVCEVAAAGVEIGSHSLVHTPLDVLPERMIDVQVRAARERLRQHTQTEVASFAYPHGYHTRLVRASVAHHGHLSACAIARGLATVDSQPFAIPRLQVTPDHGPDELLALVRSGGRQYLPRVKQMAQPAWRVVRRTANGVFGIRLS
jgi:peptidoglycan/xylan/chitin deacetylase (PgdA/CDA1 family)